MNGCFITGTGTDVGKTLLTSLLIRLRLREGLPVRAIKPVVSGYDAVHKEQSDSGLLLSASGITVNETTIAAVSPWRFAAPISPHLAAEREGSIIAREELAAFCRAQCRESPFTFIEGAGGAMAPMGEDWTVREWMTDTGLPAIVVTGSYLGSFNHTFTTVEALRAKHITLAGIAVSLSEETPVSAAEQRRTLASFCPVPLILIPRLDLTRAPFHDRNETLDRALAAMDDFHAWAKACGVA